MLGAVLGGLGAVLDGRGAVLGRSWVVVGWSWQALGGLRRTCQLFIAFIRARQPSYRGTRANKEATRSRGGDKGEA